MCRLRLISIPHHWPRRACRWSDLLFILSRVANIPIGGDVLWQPGGGRVAAPERTRAAAEPEDEEQGKHQEHGAANDAGASGSPTG